MRPDKRYSANFQTSDDCTLSIATEQWLGHRVIAFVADQFRLKTKNESVDLDQRLHVAQALERGRDLLLEDAQGRLAGLPPTTLNSSIAQRYEMAQLAGQGRIREAGAGSDHL